MLFQVVDHRGARPVERRLPVDLLVEFGGQVRVARDDLFGLLHRERRPGGGRSRAPGGGECEQCGEGDRDETAFHQSVLLLSMIFLASMSCLSAGVSMIGRSTRWVTVTSGTIPLWWMSSPLGVT